MDDLINDNLYPPSDLPTKNPLRSLWGWTRQSWKREILVSFVALVALGGVSHAASANSSTSSTHEVSVNAYCNATMQQLLSGASAPDAAKNDYLATCRANITPALMDPQVVYDIQNNLPVSADEAGGLGSGGTIENSAGIGSIGNLVQP